MVLVTGGTGLVGSHLLYQLVKSNEEVRAIYREDSSFEGIKSVFRFLGDTDLFLYQKIEWIVADINDVPALSQAFEGIHKVYHCAALVSFLPSDFEKLCKINIEGTANIVNLCIDYSVEKLCFVSSVATLGSAKGRKANEEDLWNKEDENNVYAISKNGAEMEVWRASQEGVPIVVVNPSVILGYGFLHKGMGEPFEKVKNGLSYYPQGGTGWVYVEDVAQAMHSLMNSDIHNERFILNAENLSYREVLSEIAQHLAVKRPTKVVPKWILQVGWRVDYLLSLFGLKNRKLTKLLARSLNHITMYDGAKITRKINFSYTPISVAIEKIVLGMKKKSKLK